MSEIVAWSTACAALIAAVARNLVALLNRGDRSRIGQWEFLAQHYQQELVQQAERYGQDRATHQAFVEQLQQQWQEALGELGKEIQDLRRRLAKCEANHAAARQERDEAREEAADVRRQLEELWGLVGGRGKGD